MIEIIVYITVVIFSCLMNLRQETTVIAIWYSAKDNYKELMNRWHFNDALVRVILIPYFSLVLLDYNLLKSTVLSYFLFVVYLIIFNFGWNIIKGNHILYLGDYARTDRLIKYRITELINKVLSKILKRSVTIHYYYVYTLILLLLITLAVFLLIKFKVL